MVKNGKILQIYNGGLHMENHESFELVNLITKGAEYVKKHMKFKPKIADITQGTI